MNAKVQKCHIWEGVTSGSKTKRCGRILVPPSVEGEAKARVDLPGQHEIALGNLWMERENQIMRVFGAVCQGAMGAGGSLGTRKAWMPGVPPGSHKAGPHQLAPVALSPARVQGRQPGGSHSLGHQAWAWGWDRARLGHQPSGRDPGLDHHWYSKKARKCGSQKKMIGPDGDSSQCCLGASSPRWYQSD